MYVPQVLGVKLQVAVAPDTGTFAQPAGKETFTRFKVALKLTVPLFGDGDTVAVTVRGEPATAGELKLMLVLVGGFFAA